LSTSKYTFVSAEVSGTANIVPPAEHQEDFGLKVYGQHSSHPTTEAAREPKAMGDSVCSHFVLFAPDAFFAFWPEE